MTANRLPCPSVLIDCPCHTGESPLWHADEQRLYWTDIPACRLYRCDHHGDALESFATEAPVGGFTLQADGSLLLFMARGAIKTWRNGVIHSTLLAEIPAERDSRFNDVIADPLGRVFAGTMSSPAHGGRLYRLDLSGDLSLLAEGMKTPNGMGFSPDRRSFYQNDSRASCIYRYRYDEVTGAITDRETLRTITPAEDQGRPDGLTVDAEGALWTARWDGACAVRHAPDGTPRQILGFPTRNISSLTFGGPDMTTAFFTSAGGDNREKNGALAGSLFVCCNMPVRGRPEYRSRVRL